MSQAVISPSQPKAPSPSPMTPLPPRAQSMAPPPEATTYKAPDKTMEVWRRELMVVESLGLASTMTMLRNVLRRTYGNWEEVPWENKEDQMREEMQRIEQVVSQINEEFETKDMLELEEDQQQYLDDEAEIHNAEEWMRRHLTEGTDEEETMEQVGRQETTFEG